MFLISLTLKLILANLWIGLGTNCIKLLGLAVPDQVKVRDFVELRCLYDLEGESLYALSWTFNKKEFYRFVPKENPRKQLYPLPHFKVNMSESHEGTIRLQMLNKTATGTYRCEVSTENTFRTLNAEKQIFVVNSKAINLSYSFRLTFALLIFVFFSKKKIFC